MSRSNFSNPLGEYSGRQYYWVGPGSQSGVWGRRWRLRIEQSNLLRAGILMIVVRHRSPVGWAMVRDMKRSMCMNEWPMSNTAVQVRERQYGRRTNQRYYSADCGKAGHFIQYHLEFAVRSTATEFSKG
jgi:hypothetical protein